MINNQALHKSVLLDEVLYYLSAQLSGNYIDATFGAGGYSKKILDANINNKLTAIDRDSNVVINVEKFKIAYPDRFTFYQSRFAQLEEISKENDLSNINGIVFDLGVSSMQLDQAERGFSFNKKAPLDMRMGDNDLSAYEVVNLCTEEDLANIIFKYGEERHSRKIARFIQEQRSTEPIKYTTQLADIITRAKPKIYGKEKIHPATKTFQAIRIYVNKELEELKIALEASKNILSKGGRLVIVSFHGLEDKIVKNFIKENSDVNINNNRYLPTDNTKEPPSFKRLNKKIIKASDVEVNNNPRSRSAILRAVEKL
jgi:16S rRNA (cytosine1402-N4)-methyltransferase